MKSFLKTAIFTVLGGCLVFSGCSKSSDHGANSSTAKGGAQQTIELKHNDFDPEGIPVSNYFKDSIKKIAERTEGRIKITGYFGSTLVNMPETLKAVSTGICDTTYYFAGLAPGALPLNEFFTLPLLGFKDLDQTQRIYKRIIDEIPEFKEEVDKLGVVYLGVPRPITGFHIQLGVDKLVRVPSDMKGMKIQAEGYVAKALSSIGVSPILLSPGDMYSALQKGVVSGVIQHYNFVHDFKLDELTKTHSLFPGSGLSNGAMLFLANKSSWNRIPPENRKIILEEIDNYNKRIAAYDLESEKKDIELAKAAGQKFIKVTPEESAQWKATIGKYAADAWIKTVTDRGYDGKRIFDTIQKMISEDNANSK